MTEVLEDRRQKEDLDQRASAAISAARRHASAGEHQQGLLLLQAFSPSHPLVEGAAAEIAAEAAKVDQHRRSEEEAKRRARIEEEARQRARAEEEARQRARAEEEKRDSALALKKKRDSALGLRKRPGNARGRKRRRPNDICSKPKNAGSRRNARRESGRKPDDSTKWSRGRGRTAQPPARPQPVTSSDRRSTASACS